MTEKEKEPLNVPFEEHISIDLGIREKLFKELYAKYIELYGVKLVYAFLNYNPDSPIDYVLVYKGRNPGEENDLIIYDAVPRHSSRAITSYRYYRRMKQERLFYEYGINSMVVMLKPNFDSFLVNAQNLSLEKEHPRYWKKPEFANHLCDELLEMSLMWKTRTK